MNKHLFSALKIWIPLAIVTTVLAGLIYVSVQQNYRMSANDPQIQISEDIANQAANGQNPQAFLPRTKVDISRSLASFIMLYDKNGKLTGSSAILDGKDPVVPSGVFNSTKTSGEERFTWQPKIGVRQAVVISYYNSENTSGFILIGRSLREVEVRIDNLTKMFFAALGLALISSFAAILFLQKLNKANYS
jgi:hypothetical protein